MITQEIKDRVAADPGFIYSSRFGDSLDKMMERYPDSVPDRIAAQVLCLTVDDLEALWEGVLVKLRGSMGAN